MRIKIYNDKYETMHLEQLRQLQNKRLVALVNRVNQDVPFYRKKFKEVGLQVGDIKTMDDLHKIPFTYKTDLRENYPFGLFAKPMSQINRIHASSGTTGQPTVVGYTQNDLEIFDEVVARSLVCAGAQPGMNVT